MRNAPANWTSITAGSYTHEYRIAIYSSSDTPTYYYEDNIQGTPIIEQPLIKEPMIGRCCTATLTLTLRGVASANIPKAAKIIVDTRVKNATTLSGWLTLGRFYVSKRKDYGEILALTCRDSMVFAGKKYADLTAFEEWPQRMYAVAQEIAGIMGVTFPADVVNSDVYMADAPNEDTLISEVLGWIAAAHGGNYIISPDGVLKLVRLPSTGTPVLSLGGSYNEYTPYSSGALTISRATLKDSADNEYAKGDDSGDEEIVAACEYATQAIANNLTVGQAYRPYDLAVARIDPRLELGDTFSISVNGTTVSLIAGTIILELDAHLTASISAGVEADNEEEVPYLSTRDLQLSRTIRTDQIYFGNRINRKEGFVSELLINDTPVARLTANAEQFLMESYTAADGWQNAVYFDPITGKYVFTGAVTVEGMITSTDLATSGSTIINGDNITTGTISTDNVRISGGLNFKWDGDYIVAIDPTNANKQIRFGLYDGSSMGIGYTTDGGVTWQNAIGFNGVTLAAGSVSTSNLSTELQNDLQDMADSIADLSDATTIYYSRTAPTDPADGDIWYDLANSKIKRYSGSAWVDITTDALKAALDAAETAQTTADGKIKTYAQTSAPTGLSATDVGDLWFDTDDSNKLYRWSGSAWVVYQDTHYDSTISSLQTLAAGKSTIYYSSSAPASPSTGDLWYDLSTANDVKIKRYNGSSWVDITTNALQSALTAAGTAQTTADGKIKTYAQDSAPTGMTSTDVGDLWIDTDDNNTLYRYSGTAWVKYEDTHYDSTISSLQTLAAGKSTIYYSSSAPTNPANGDIWYDISSTNDIKIKRYNGSAWADITTNALQAALSAAGTAQATADGKIKTYAQTSAPTGLSTTDVGDLWIDTDDNNTLYRYSGTAWVKYEDTHNDSAISNLQSLVASKSTIYYAALGPSSPITGDVWYDTAYHKIRRYTGSAWLDITDEALYSALSAAATAKSVADGKIKTYAQTSAPASTTANPLDTGDLWIDTDDNNKLYRWNGSSWVAFRDDYLESRVTDVELKTTDSAIIATVTSSTTYKADTANRNYCIAGSVVYNIIDGECQDFEIGDQTSKRYYYYRLNSSLFADAGGATFSSVKISMDIKRTSVSTTDSSSRYFRFGLTYRNSSGTLYTLLSIFKTSDTDFVSTDSDWVRVRFSVSSSSTSQAIASLNYVQVGTYAGMSGTIQVRNVKAEISSDYTPYSLAPEDTTDFSTRLSTAEARIEENQISFVVTNGVITSMYSQTASDIKLQAEKIYAGYWTFTTSGFSYDNNVVGVNMTVLTGGATMAGASYADDPSDYRAFYGSSDCDVQYGSDYDCNVYMRGKRIILMAGSDSSSMAVMGIFKSGEGSGTEYSFFPAVDNTGNLGSSKRRWNLIRYGTGGSSSSSRTKKKNIMPIPECGDIIDQLDPVEFDFIVDGTHSDGFILEDTYKLLPIVCDVEDGDFDNGGIFYDRFIPFLVREIQSLRKRVKQLEGGTA